MPRSTGGVAISIMADLISAQVEVQGASSFAARSGVSRAAIEKILSRESGRVSIDTADKLICKGLQRPDYWTCNDDLRDALESEAQPVWVPDSRYKAGGYYRQSRLAKADYDRERRSNAG